MRVACLISGSGTNLGALIEAEQAGQLGQAKLVGVFSNRQDAPGLARATAADLPVAWRSHRDDPSREAFDAKVIEILEIWQPDLVALAGFMRILSPHFVQFYRHRLINIHPSLLPKYKGLDTHRRALEAGDSHAGATVHWVTDALDDGEIIDQIQVPIAPNDTPDTLRARVLASEHVLYPRAIRKLANEQRLS